MSDKYVYILFIMLIAILLSSQKIAISARINNKNTTFIAYHGGHGDAPENTMAAFKEAVKLGANGLMIDIRRTKDNKLVLMYDETIDRTTDGMGRVDQLFYDELRLYDAGSWKGDQFVGEKIPLLSEVLSLARANGLKLILNVRQFGLEKEVLDLVKTFDMLDHVYFWGTLRNITKLEPGLPIYNLVFLRYDEIAREIIDQAHAERNHIMTWISDDNREALISGINNGADVIVVNYPQLIMDVLQTNEPRKIVDSDSADKIMAGKKEGLPDEPSQTHEKRKEWPQQTTYIRDQASTLANIIKTSKGDDSRLAALAMASLFTEDAVPTLINLLDDKEPSVRGNAAWSLGITGDKMGLSPLIRLLDERNPHVRREAVLALKRIVNLHKLSADELKPVTERLLKILIKDREPRLRYDAARTLGDLQDRGSMQKLIYALQNDTNWDVKAACAGAIGRIMAPEGIKTLKDLLINDAEMDAAWARNRAAWALQEIGTPAIEALLTALGDNEPSVRIRAGWALIKIGKPAVSGLILILKSANSLERERATWTLGWIKDNYAVNALTWGLKDKTPYVRTASAWALGRIGDAKALNALERARKDTDAMVRENVLEAIERIKKQE